MVYAVTKCPSITILYCDLDIDKLFEYRYVAFTTTLASPSCNTKSNFHRKYP